MSGKLQVLLSVFLLTTQLFGFAEVCEYLIISPDRFIPKLDSFIHWKTKKGIITKLVPLSVVGEKPEEIKEFVRRYYYYAPELKYLLLIGDVEELSPYPHPQVGFSDAPYGDVDNDTILEIMVGRLPARNTRQLLTMINRIFNYERRPYLKDTMFYKKATTIRQDPGPYHNAGSYFVRNLILNNPNFISVDTFVNPPHTKYDLKDSLKAGRSYVLYTGHGAGTHWVSPFDLSPYFNNAYKTPVIFSWCCKTVLQKNYLGQKWLKPGSPKIPRGAVTFIGTTTSGLYARYRNFVARNFFRAIFEQQISEIGQALKIGLDSLWQYTPDSFGHILYQEWNLIGDPTLQLWTSVPKPLICLHDTILENPASVAPFTIRVLNTDSHPVARALVCLTSKEAPQFFYRGYTSCLGSISFDLEVGEIRNFEITVTKPNYIPYESRCAIFSYTRLTSLKENKSPSSAFSHALIYDLQGRLIRKVPTDFNLNKLSLPQGIYYLLEPTLTTKEPALNRKKLIIIK
jgi:hypothetical protein